MWETHVPYVILLYIHCWDSDYTYAIAGRHDAGDETVVLDYNKGKPRLSTNNRSLGVLLSRSLCLTAGAWLPVDGGAHTCIGSRMHPYSACVRQQ